MIKSISWVLPLFNEAEYVGITIPAAIALMNSLGMEYEIIIVDDGSSDESTDLIHEFMRENRNIRLLRHEQNRGLGACLRTGFNAAAKEIVIYTDIDMPFDFTLLKDILPLIEKADIVHGYRTGSRESFKRTMYTRIYNFLIRKIFGLPVTDVNFSLDIIRRDIINGLNLKSEASFIAAELLTKAYYAKYTITQVPVPYTPRLYGVSRLSSPFNICKIVSEMIRYRPEITAPRHLNAHEKSYY
jgi:glycosyltransferase involved in cell wall biosynthesis